MLVHGDDFVLLADDGEIKAEEELLKNKFTIKVVSVIGDGSLQQEVVILNRIVRYVPRNTAHRMAMENRARSAPCGHLVAGAWPR